MTEIDLKKIYETEFKSAYEKQDFEKAYDLMCSYSGLVNLLNEKEAIFSLRAVYIGSAMKMSKNLTDCTKYRKKKGIGYLENVIKSVCDAGEGK